MQVIRDNMEKKLKVIPNGVFRKKPVETKLSFIIGAYKNYDAYDQKKEGSGLNILFVDWIRNTI